MWPLIVRFFTDETAFVGYIRALLLCVGGIIVAYPEALPVFPKWVGVLAMSGAGMIRAGEMNAKPSDWSPGPDGDDK
jgi:hypothetical protein